MINQQTITDLIKGKPLEQPIELTIEQRLLLEVARDIKVIRSGVGSIAFLMIAGVILGLIIGFFQAVM